MTYNIFGISLVSDWLAVTKNVLKPTHCVRYMDGEPYDSGVWALGSIRFLLSETELFGKNTLSSYKEGEQYCYYADNGDALVKSIGVDDCIQYWTRSVYYDGGIFTPFNDMRKTWLQVTVDSDGTLTTHYQYHDLVYYSFAFCV